MGDFTIWYAKNKSLIKIRQLYKKLNTEDDSHWAWIELPNGERRRTDAGEKAGKSIPAGSRRFQLISLYLPSFSANSVFKVEFEGKKFLPRLGACWITNPEGMNRLKAAKRVMKEGTVLRYVLFEDDFPYTKLTTFWNDTQGVQGKRYVVQTSEKVVQRCMMMTTLPYYFFEASRGRLFNFDFQPLEAFFGVNRMRTQTESK